MSTIDTRLSERLDALSPAQREALLKKLKERQSTQKPDAFSMHRPIVHNKQDSNRYALSSGQQRLWFLEQLEPGKPTYHIACALNLKGTLNQLSLNHALQAITDRHASLRTTFTEQHDGVFQQVGNKKAICLHHRSTSEDSLNTALEKEINHPFDLLNGPLCRVTLFTLNDQHHVLSLVLHHIIADAWSCQVLIAELSALYGRHNADEAALLPALPCQYTDFAHWQATLFKQPLIEKQRAFWLETLKNSQPIALPLDSVRPKTISYRGDFVKTSIASKQTDALTALCHQANVTLFHGLMSLFQTLLFRYSQQADFCIGTPVAGRNHEDTQGLIGFFVNSLAIRNDAALDLTFTALLAAVKNTTLNAQSHQDIPFEAIVDALELPRDSSVSPVFQVFFSYNPDDHNAQFALSELDTSLISIDSQTAKFDLSLIIHTSETELSCHFEYNADIFERSTIVHLSKAFQCLLNSACNNPSTPIQDLSLLDDADKKTLTVLGESPKTLPTITDIATLFEQQAASTPLKNAIIEGETSTTFQALNTRANQLACTLREKGVTKGCRVGIHFSPSIDLVVAMLATIKTQATYVPMDTHLPIERLQYMATHAQMALILTESPIDDLPTTQLCLSAINEEGSTQNAPTRDTAHDQPFYMLYTSGSTGKPKAASVSHLNASNLYHWYKETFSLSEEDKLLVFSSIGFDLTQKNIWASLCFGAELHFTGNEYYDPTQINQTIATQGISWINCAPSAFYPLVDHCRDFSTLASLKQVFLGGETVQSHRLQAWLDHNSTQAALINMYGPTECTDIATFYRHRPNDKKLPIGRPIDNIKLYVLDKRLNRLPLGAIGELCIAGTPTGLGYHDDEARNAAAFVANPYSQSMHDKTLYRTGDLVRYNSEHNLEFIARNDSQIKIRGFRVEPGEIEAVIKQLPDIQDAVVTLKSYQQHEQLIAYMVSDNALQPARFYQQALSQQLADFMIPAVFVSIDKVPLNTNGKVDRKRLPDIELQRTEEIEYIAPRNATEAELVNIWESLLSMEKIGVTDNFFHSGGHSLLATQLLIRIREQFFIDLPMRTLFEINTIEGLAEVIFAMQANHEHLDEDALEEGIL